MITYSWCIFFRHADCEAICKLGLKAKILTHIRCHMDDARIAVETGASMLI